MALTWKATKQSHGVVKMPDGNYVSGWTVDFETSDGVTDSVQVPDTEWSVDSVKRLILERVETIEGISNLGEHTSSE